VDSLPGCSTLLGLDAISPVLNRDLLISKAAQRKGGWLSISTRVLSANMTSGLRGEDFHANVRAVEDARARLLEK
jgi:hypothetical protein